MLGIDTNILVRFLVQDDEAQFEKARKLIKREVAAGRRVFCHLQLRVRKGGRPAAGGQGDERRDYGR